MSIVSAIFKNETSESITTSHELAAFLDQYGGWSSTAGINVTPKTAMACAAVSAAVGLIAENVALLPLKLYQRRDDGGKDQLRDTRLWQVLHDRPNPWQNAFEYREQATLHLALWANHYALKTISRTGEVLELLPIHPSRVKPKQDERFRVTYEVTGPDGTVVTLPARRVFHVRDRSFDGVIGRPRILDAKDTIGLSLAAERWGGQLFGNGARPSGVLSTENNLTDEQIDRLKESWVSAHGGAKALGTAVLDRGLKWTPLVMSNTDSQLLETRRFQIAEVARIFRVPPTMIGDDTAAKFSNVEQWGLQFLKFTLMSWLRRWEFAINHQLVDRDDQDTVFAEFNVAAFERGDLKTQTVHFTAGLRDGYYNRNEVRDMLGMNPIEGGDEYHRAESIHGPQDDFDDDDDDDDSEDERDDDQAA